MNGKEFLKKEMNEDFIQKTDLFRAGKKVGIKAIEINRALKEMGSEVEFVEKDGEVFVRLSPEPAVVETVKELKRAPENRPRRTLVITEEEAETLSVGLRTPPVKNVVEYPEGVSQELYKLTKGVIIEENELLKDLVSGFNGARNIAITMWDPENSEADERGKVFYRWDNPLKSWGLMKDLLKIVGKYNVQEGKVEVPEEMKNFWYEDLTEEMVKVLGGI